MNSTLPNRANSSDRGGPSETATTIASYDATAAQFASRWGTLRLERALAAFTQHLVGRRQVLDLGCGPGRDVDFLTRLDCTVVGLDLSAGMLSEARIRLPDASLVRADLRLTPFASDRFDGIWACASLLHLPRAGFAPTLAEVIRLLRQPGGVLYLALKGGQGEQWVTGHDGRRTFFAYYQPDEIETSLAHTGFQILERWTAEDQAGRNQPWINVVARL
jgi:SAM-dependent methyltransferase